jgi:hypothetical protein
MSFIVEWKFKGQLFSVSDKPTTRLTTIHQLRPPALRAASNFPQYLIAIYEDGEIC